MLIITHKTKAATQEFRLTLKNHIFTPSEIIIPANTKVKLLIINQDNTIEEFDSFDLNREKVLFPKKIGRVFIGPLLPGRYEYFGEYFPHTARGIVIVEAKHVD
ncbi:hypothetical protein XM47_00870 [Catenovulum maritimum]|uniref:EfeO-type cupredoxin-like domain-containing protein n=2 Tax=Catenovulum maritimum TaxID=1513271 RepID=A0A0J8JQI2_9ALTE|nr:cupredoxin domain-containing protein [Catenovulum maritimum]KMT66996.1 hypothetical protein XM47_00870 [Catenovulum maritimum]